MIYVAGKIRGLNNYDIPFLMAKKFLKKQGLNHITAVDLLERINYKQLQEKSIIDEINSVIYDSENICMIPNYFTSAGSQLEMYLAKYYKKEVTILDINDLLGSTFLKDFIKKFGIKWSSNKPEYVIYKHTLIYIIYNLFDLKYHSYETIFLLDRSTIRSIDLKVFAFIDKRDRFIRDDYVQVYSEVLNYLRNYYAE